MNYPRKLKQDSSITGLLPAIAAIAVLIVANIFWGKPMAYKALAAILLAWLIYLLITRKTKWKGREVLELAAMPVEETSDGFIDRLDSLKVSIFT